MQGQANRGVRKGRKPQADRETDGTAGLGATGALWPAGRLQPADRRSLRSAAAVLASSAQQHTRVTWLPAFGCALVAVGFRRGGGNGAELLNGSEGAEAAAEAGRGGGVSTEQADEGSGGQGGVIWEGAGAGGWAAPGELALHLVSLDGWAFRVHPNRVFSGGR